ncbi:hypothetical protein CK203_036297 [Vitis vinifera]|uniref:RNase H type-1 domain-containing protein n=1 Tax=Vitis vinifera TaxID=29760 RepID=A0A438HT50_VITVI|nr:hypothetical protein CK203_036297 [Vitis vinifera]
MVDFMVELPQKPAHAVEFPGEQWWTLHVDGTFRVSESGIAKYEVILVGLNLAIAFSATRLEIRNDSQLIVGKIQKEYEAKDESHGSPPHHVEDGHSRPRTHYSSAKEILLVATNYFSKWVKVEAYASIKDKNVSKRPTEASPFAVTYGMEVIIQIEIGMPTIKTIVQGQRDNDEELVRHLDWVDEI